MKKIIYVVLAIALAGGLYTLWQSEAEVPQAGAYYSFNSATSTISNLGTSTLVNITTWTQLKYSGNKGVGFVALCHNNDTPNANNPVYLGFNSTSTKPFGYRLNPGECYRMTQQDENMFYGTMYAIASSASTTLLEIYK